jgi:DNA-binding LacI/PurR family transcriptional regulator
MTRQKITIREIAKIVGVSHTTVSRALNNDPRVSPQTREKIFEVAKARNYKPPRIAKALAPSTLKLIGLLVYDISNPFHSELVAGMEAVAHKRGYNLVFLSTKDRPVKDKFLKEMILQSGIAGIIITSAKLQDPQVKDLIREQFPLVLVNRRISGDHYNYVICDNIRGAFEATSHLTKLGYRKIGAIIGSPTISTGIDRLKGYQKAL